jgi:riboflavin kinase/FMN adenylyltransferase
MIVLNSGMELPAAKRKVCLAIGFFDGVHLGHQQIIRQTLADARQHEGTAVILTFDRHPNTVVAPARVPPLIYSLSQKLRVIESLGAELLLLIHFDSEFSQQTGEAFVARLVRDLGQLHSICVGANFTFGHRRSGNVALLQELGRKWNFTVHGLAAVMLDGKAVSSTRIREAIANGQLDSASQMLGRAYSFAGRVTTGDGLGRKLGFPTANIDCSGLALPPKGVYAAHVEADGRSLRAVLNIGLRPTLQTPEPELRVEAHLLDFDGDLYGKELEITLVERVRDEQKFKSLAALRSQIAKDISEARLRF